MRFNPFVLLLLLFVLGCTETITESKSTCGDPFICEAGENSQNCPSDCTVSTSDACNNDGLCQPPIENSVNCPTDCAIVTADPPATVNAVLTADECNSERCAASFEVTGSGILSVHWTFSGLSTPNESEEFAGRVTWAIPARLPMDISARVTACSTASRDPNSCAPERSVSATFNFDHLPPTQCSVTASEQATEGTFLLTLTDASGLIDPFTCTWLGSQGQTASGGSVTLAYPLDGTVAVESATASCRGAGGITCSATARFDVD